LTALADRVQRTFIDDHELVISLAGEGKALAEDLDLRFGTFFTEDQCLI